MAEDVTALCGQSKSSLSAPDDRSVTESDWQVRRRMPESRPLNARLSVRHHGGQSKGHGVTSAPRLSYPGVVPASGSRDVSIDCSLDRVVKSSGNQAVSSSFSPSGDSQSNIRQLTRRIDP